MGDRDRDSGEAAEAEMSANLPAPWEHPDYGADAEPPLRTRHDAFTPARRQALLTRLAKHGCFADAARKTGVSLRTIYNHRDKDEAFARDCDLALRMAGGSMELAAWERAVEGVDQLFACGGQVHVRKRYSDGLLRLLLQGARPKKYGPNPGFSRKRLLAWERKQLEKEVEARFLATQRATEAELNDSILRKLEILSRRKERDKMAAPKGDEGDSTPRDSVGNSCKS
jgi:hypothetical protein